MNALVIEPIAGGYCVSRNGVELAHVWCLNDLLEVVAREAPAPLVRKLERTE